MTPRMSAAAAQACRGLYAHRLLTTSQVHELHGRGRSRRRTLQVLVDLEDAGYVARVGVHGSREFAWHLTPDGAAVTEGAGVDVRRHRMTAALAAGPQQSHTLATNEAALCFVREARRRGHDCGPFAWRNETAHPLGPGQGSLIADAVLDYTVWTATEEVYLCRFLEVDMATELVSVLARKLTSYARLLDYPAGWMAYPSFPRLVIVLAGGEAAALERRLNVLCEVAGRLPALAARPEIGAVAVTLEALRREGPLAPVFVPLIDPSVSVDVLGYRAA